jgi:GMP synthase-like glutamine amidotransferase
MSANDPLPALRQAERLFLQALDHGVPTIGHCLGGQLMARALGARVTDSPAPEVGWQTIEVLDSVAAASWLGPAGATEVFHWHYEAFDLPAGAELLARSRACPNQAFAIGPHLAMQFHVEVDAAKIDLWSRDEDPRYDRAFGAHSSVQSPAQMRAAVAAKLAAHQALADRVYARWASAAGLP